MKPSFIGIGAQKCASTWVHRVLQDHPQVAASELKELNFFSYNYDRGFQWYENHFHGAPHAAVGEISPSYFYDLAAPQRAYRYNPNFRIIVTLRDPVERAYSNHLHELRIRNYTGDNLSFEAGLANNPMYIEQSRYATHIKRWLSIFDASQMLILLQEEIKTEPSEQARRLYEFLNIDTSHRSEFIHARVNKSQQPRIGALDYLFKKAGTLARGLGLNDFIMRAKKGRLINTVRQANTVALREVTPPMCAETKHYLQGELADEVIALAELLERPYLPWETWEAAQARIKGYKQPLHMTYR